MLIKFFCLLIAIIVGTYVVYIGCNKACEYFSFGHKFVRAFIAHSAFQKLFTAAQSKSSMNEKNIGKITYIGYFSSILCTISAVFVIPLSLIMFYFNIDLAFHIYGYWVSLCLLLLLFICLIQILDSILNFLLGHYNKQA